MARFFRLMLSFVLIGVVARAQETVHWASRVVEVSSEASRLEYSAMQALHKPNVLPAHGDNPNAWKPDKDSKNQFIVVMFDEPINAQQVAIAETQNPGSVTRVFAYDTDEQEHLLFDMEPRQLPIESRLLNLFFERTNYKIEALRVELDVETVDGDHSIDAIGISDSNIPISVLINVASYANENLQAEKLNEDVNSQYIEHSPILSPDGKRLYFSRRGHPDNIGGKDDPEDIWFSELNEDTGEWLPAKNLGGSLNNAGPNFISAIIPEGDDQVLLLGNRYGKKGKMFAGVSMARINPEGVISEPENIDIINDYNYSPSADYYPSLDQKVILMSVERDDTFGKRDLYVSFKTDAQWTEPLSLGSVVNSAADETSPHLMSDNKTLYYSSSGFSGFGGADVYKTTRLDNTWTKWSEPENMGGGLNSISDDVYFHIPDNSKHAYFTRGDINNDTDIFRFTIEDLYIDSTFVKEVNIALSGKVLNAKTNQPIAGASVVVDEESNTADIADLTSGTDGNYLIELKSGLEYGIVASEAGYTGKKEIVDVPIDPSSTDIKRDLYLIPDVPEIKTIVYFNYNKSDLSDEYIADLEKLVPYFETRGIDILQISGHTDSVGSDSFNIKLSEKRAGQIRDFFVGKGISVDRLKVVPNGEASPAVPNTSDENRAKNRRVEFQLIDNVSN